jgi:hypothetical protein
VRFSKVPLNRFAEICTSQFKRKEIAQNLLFSIGDSSFVYIRGTGVALYTKEDFDELLTRGLEALTTND